MKNKYIRNFIIYITIFIVLFNSSNIVLADDVDDNEVINEVEQNEIAETINENKANEVNNVGTNDLKPTINSRRYVVYDRNSGIEIYGKDSNKQTSIASTTKILTAIIVLENCENLEDIVTIDSKAAAVGGSTIKLKKDDKITVNDLLYGLLLRSGNDAAIALAKYTAGDVNDFANLMNNKAQELGLRNSHFVTPHGLDDPNHYTTAYELAEITDYALRNQKFASIVKCKTKTIMINGVSKTINNTNEILNSNVDGVYGVKTGFTNNAGRCLVTAVKRDNIDLIIVVLGADTRKDRAKDTIKLINYIFKEYKTENLEEKIKEEYERWKQINKNRIFINKARTELNITIEEIPIKTIVTNKQTDIQITSLTYLEAPIKKDTRIGTITVKNNDSIIEQINIIAKENVEKINIFDFIYIIAKVIVN